MVALKFLQMYNTMCFFLKNLPVLYETAEVVNANAVSICIIIIKMCVQWSMSSIIASAYTTIIRLEMREIF